MTSVQAAFSRDENFVPIQALGFTQTKTITYVASTTGATGETTLFTVTGTVAVRVFAYCSALLDQTGATSTIEVGVTEGTNTAAIIAQTGAIAIDAGEIWYGTNPPNVGVMPNQLILVDTDIVQTIAGNTVKQGVLTYYCLWFPISSDGNVVAA